MGATEISGFPTSLAVRLRVSASMEPSAPVRSEAPRLIANPLAGRDKNVGSLCQSCRFVILVAKPHCLSLGLWIDARSVRVLQLPSLSDFFEEVVMVSRTAHPAWLRASLIALVLVATTSTAADGIASYEFATPLFGLATAPDGSLLVADAGSGIVELRKGVGSLVVALPGVTDVAPIGRGDMFATIGGGPGLTTGRLFRVSRGRARQIADLYAFEAAVNPHPASVDSNPFDVEVLNGGIAVVADAGGNDLLMIDQASQVDWIAAFPNELVSTADLKTLAGCPVLTPGFEFICFLPPMLPAQPVSTSVAIGPDGAYYVGELKGFPAPRGESRIWRIEPGTLHTQCPSAACTMVADGFTSIVDLTFGPAGTLYVVELDEASWAAVEFPFPGLGGTVNACDISTWTCTEAATGLPMPIAATVDRNGTVYVAINALVPGDAEVIALP